MRLQTVTLKDKKVFEEFLHLDRHELSAYSFDTIFTWKGIGEIYWKVIAGSLCVFFQDPAGCFLCFPPLGKEGNGEAVAEGFRIMDRKNKNKSVSRIENIEEHTVRWFQDAGYVCREKFGEYICRREDLVSLRGECFKHKRSAYNYFVRNYGFTMRKFMTGDAGACIRLYKLWKKTRREVYRDPIYQGMQDDSQRCLEVLLRHYKQLSFWGRVVEVEGALKAFTFGVPLSRNVFCVLFEIADLSVKGVSQFIFREFIRECRGYAWVNIMDDSGLENLQKVKLSYRPARMARSYIARRKEAYEP
jgi:hypothetical protein